MTDVRLIDADKYPCQTCNVSHCYQNCEKFVEWFNNTVDAVPVVHGRWEKHKTMHGFVYCSACRDVYLDAEWLADGKWTYCPNCGAKMDLEV